MVLRTLRRGLKRGTMGGRRALLFGSIRIHARARTLTTERLCLMQTRLLNPPVCSLSSSPSSSSQSSSSSSSSSTCLRVNYRSESSLRNGEERRMGGLETVTSTPKNRGSRKHLFGLLFCKARSCMHACMCMCVCVCVCGASCVCTKGLQTLKSQTNCLLTFLHSFPSSLRSCVLPCPPYLPAFLGVAVTDSLTLQYRARVLC